ncbi:MAG: DUF3267 domain-containing protein [Anaerolineales bacterium]|nr:DUF3267 domain-containing protein [Anaerolineales bacterium]
MKPTHTLPIEYEQSGVLDLTKDKRLMIGVNLLSIVVLFISESLFSRLAMILRRIDSSITIYRGLTPFLGFILVVILAIVVHEIIHGFSFWLFTGGKPKFGFKGLYAYAAAPDWYLPRREYVFTALAPLVLITLVGVLMIPVVSDRLLPFLLILVVINFAGSVGDATIVLWILRKPDMVYINDFGDGVIVFEPAVTSGGAPHGGSERTEEI